MSQLQAEGEFYTTNFSLKLHVKSNEQLHYLSLNEFYIPIVYRRDSSPILNCTLHNKKFKIRKWKILWFSYNFHAYYVEKLSPLLRLSAQILIIKEYSGCFPSTSQRHQSSKIHSQILNVVCEVQYLIVVCTYKETVLAHQRSALPIRVNMQFGILT